MLVATFNLHFSIYQHLILIFFKYIFTDNRTYHFQAEDENDQRAWMSVLVNCKEGALNRAFQGAGSNDGSGEGRHSLLDLHQAIIRAVLRLPGNQACCDCGSTNGSTIYISSTNCLNICY